MNLKKLVGYGMVVSLFTIIFIVGTVLAGLKETLIAFAWAGVIVGWIYAAVNLIID